MSGVNEILIPLEEEEEEAPSRIPYSVFRIPSINTSSHRNWATTSYRALWDIFLIKSMRFVRQAPDKEDSRSGAPPEKTKKK